jgi:hypothetical protein
MRSLTAVLFLFILSGCSLFNNEFEVITGRYNIGYTNRPAYRVICENYTAEGDIGGIIVVDPYVFAIGHNEEFIIAKQHPIPGDDHEGEPDAGITNYYAIDINRKFHKDGVIGPLNAAQFDSVRAAWSISAMQFDRAFADKP